MGKGLAHRLALFSVKTGKTPSFLFLFGPITLKGWITGIEHTHYGGGCTRMYLCFFACVVDCL